MSASGAAHDDLRLAENVPTNWSLSRIDVMCFIFSYIPMFRTMAIVYSVSEFVMNVTVKPTCRRSSHTNPMLVMLRFLVSISGDRCRRHRGRSRVDLLRGPGAARAQARG